jgi:hypothetical protein
MGLKGWWRGERLRASRSAGHHFPPLAPKRQRDRQSLREFRHRERAEADSIE